MSPSSHNKIFYGWYIVILVFFAYFMSVGTSFYCLNAFMEPLCSLRNWTRTDINMAMVFGTFFALICQPLYGTLVMRTGPRILMAAGSVIAGISFIFLMRVQALWQFYFFYIILFVANGAYGGIVASTSVNNWFIRKRGKALGFATAGISFSGVILPPLAMFLILRSDIVIAANWIGLMIIIVGPLAWFIVKDWPENYGLLPDGADPAAIEASSGENRAIQTDHTGVNLTVKSSQPADCRPLHWTLPMLLRTGAFWRIGITYSLIMIGIVAVMSQLKPHFVTIGFSDRTAMGMMAATAFFGTIGKYVCGAYCDKYNPAYVTAVLIVTNTLGLALAFFPDSLSAVILFVIIYGFTMGGVVATLPVNVGHFFGREAFPAVLRFVALFMILQVLGYILAGQSFDRTGSYNTAFIIFIILNLIAVITITPAKKPMVNAAK